MEATTKERTKGLEFISNSFDIGETYSPKDFTEEHHMIKDMVDEFVRERIYTNAEKIEKQEQGFVEGLMEEIGELGILNAHMPQKYGGMELDFISNTLIAEGMGCSGSFSVSYNAHTGIGMLPILYFGTEDQKNKYLFKLGTGEWKASYCLTEPSSGSDALSAKTTAMLSEDKKSYVLNGQKMWISNAGFADIFIVFAQVDGDKFTGFIVEKGAEGLTLGAEEDKLGIKGSSTRQVFFENVNVPVENLLGEIGKGHHIAFNVLNIGRYKLGVSCLGGIKKVIDTSIEYANERHQFKVPISTFGAMKHKIAEQSLRAFALESSIFRLAGLMKDAIKNHVANGAEYGEAKLLAAEEFALECSIIKILGSEVLDYVVDEAVQIHGGMGFSEETTIARAYRDSRINRIFEGTNEINRLLMVNLLFKQVMKGKFDLAGPAMQVQQQLMSGALEEKEYADSPYPECRKALDRFKKLLYTTLGYAGQLAMSKAINLKETQEPVMNISDIITEIYIAESMLLRAEKEIDIKLREEMLKVQFYESAQRIAKYAYDFTGSVVDESMYGAFVKSIRVLTKFPIQNTMKLRRVIADEMIKENKYSL